MPTTRTFGDLSHYCALFQKALDKQVLAGATSAWMEGNAGQVKYNGGASIKIPSIVTSGLGDYSRQNGYATGSVSFGYQTMTMEQDRSTSFVLDSMDVDETNFVANAGAVMSTFQTDNVIPEIDAYRYSKLAALIKLGKNGGTSEDGRFGEYTPAAATLVSEIKNQIDKIKDIAGDISLVCMISRMNLSLLEQATRLEKVQFTSGNIKTEVNSIDDVPLLPVPSSRFKTVYNFKDGSQANGSGFAADTTAKDINFMIVPKNAPIAVSKTDKPKIITPELNQNADAWKIAYRKFHDLWVPDAKLKVSYLSIAK